MLSLIFFTRFLLVCYNSNSEQVLCIVYKLRRLVFFFDNSLIVHCCQHCSADGYIVFQSIELFDGCVWGFWSFPVPKKFFLIFVSNTQI